MTIKEIRFYVDRPGRDLGICRPGSTVYIDIEPGCFTTADEVRNEGSRLTEHQLKTGIYTNQGPMQEAFGASTECADWPCPLFYASWGITPFQNFPEFNGWKMPELWQVSPGNVNVPPSSMHGGIAGVNADICFDPEGHLWCDISNYSDIEHYQAYVLKNSMYGVVIGLQNTGKARYQYQMLTEGLNPAALVMPHNNG